MKTLIFLFLLLFSCKETIPKKKIVFYQDSTYQLKKDSILIDILSQVQQNGFVKIYDYKSKDQSFEQGILNKGIRTGKWQQYIDLGYKIILDEEKTYSQEGHLINYKNFDHQTKSTTQIRNYIGDNLVGIQKDFYPSGKLHIQFETDQDGHYINEFLVLSEEGQDIYRSSFGKEGNGYIKYYDNLNNLEWEGSYKNKKKEGWHHEYVIEYGRKISETTSTLYKNDEAIETQKNHK